MRKDQSDVFKRPRDFARMSDLNPAQDFFCASETERTLKDLRLKRKGQPLYVMGHEDRYKGKEGVFEFFNVRLAVVKFPDEKTLGFDPIDLLLSLIHISEPTRRTPISYAVF